LIKVASEVPPEKPWRIRVLDVPTRMILTLTERLASEVSLRSRQRSSASASSVSQSPPVISQIARSIPSPSVDPTSVAASTAINPATSNMIPTYSDVFGGTLPCFLPDSANPALLAAGRLCNKEGSASKVREPPAFTGASRSGPAAAASPDHSETYLRRSLVVMITIPMVQIVLAWSAIAVCVHLILPDVLRAPVGVPLFLLTSFWIVLRTNRSMIAVDGQGVRIRNQLTGSSHSWSEIAEVTSVQTVFGSEVGIRLADAPDSKALRSARSTVFGARSTTEGGC
jgi:hypothetical protein